MSAGDPLQSTRSRLRIGWFSTGRGPGSRMLLRAVTDAIDAGLPVEIAYVFGNRELGEDAGSDEFLTLVASLGLEAITLSSAKFRRVHGGPVARTGESLPAWRLAYDDAVLELVKPFGTTLGVLAGYMLIFGPRACEELCLLNLHPAAPGGPKGIWQDVIWNLIGQRASTSGITIFRAIPEVDAGPPLSFCTYSLRGGGIDGLWEQIDALPMQEVRARWGEEGPLFGEIRRRGAIREPKLLVETLGAISNLMEPKGLGPNESVSEKALIETALGRGFKPLDLSRKVDTALDRSASAER